MARVSHCWSMLHGQIFCVRLCFSCAWWHPDPVFLLLLWVFFCLLCHYVDWCCTEVILFWIIWVFRHQLTHTKKADYEKTKCRIMLRLTCAVSFMFWSLHPAFSPHSFWWIPSAKCWCFWTRNAFSSILVRHCVGRHSIKSYSCFFLNKDWKSGRVTLHREFELELTALLVTQSFIYSDVSLLVSSYLLICLDDFHSKVVSKMIIFYCWWGYQVIKREKKNRLKETL